MDLQAHLTDYSQDLQNTLGDKLDQIKSALISVERNCFQTAGDDSDKFVACMYSTSKYLQKEEKSLNLRTAFFQAQAAECIMNSGGNSYNVKECKDNAISNIQNSFNIFINNMKF